MRILDRGDNWLAVHKPASMTVHNNKGEDLVSILSQHLNGSDVYLVNRLDFGVSGVVLAATTKSCASQLQQQFEHRTVVKRYVALGSSPKKASKMTNFSGTWKWYLTKRAEGRSNPQGFQKMRVPCKTEWGGQLLNETTLALEIKPLTGRKHQIRRHAALAGWPLLGDDRYGPKVDNSEPVDQSEPTYNRLALHAAGLEFSDPKDGRRIHIVDPIDWPTAGFAIRSNS